MVDVESVKMLEHVCRDVFCGVCCDDHDSL